MKIKSINHTKLDTPVKVYDVINATPYHNFLIDTKTSIIVSHNCALMDEISFSQGQDVNYTKSKIMDVYTNIRRRMESRFMVKGHNYGLMFLVSSKSTEMSFLDAYITDQVKKGYPIYVVDQPLWVVKPGAYSGKKFQVAVGNKYLPSRVINIDDPEKKKVQIDAYLKQGLRVIDVPVEHKQAFDQDIDKALQDIAGISTSVVTKAFSLQRIQKCISDTLENPFVTEVLTIGMHDDLQLKDFFRPELIPDNMRGSPIFVHFDTSVKGDKTGISGVGIAGVKSVVRQVLKDLSVDHPDEDESVYETVQSEELIYQQVFTVGIKAPSDSEISFEKSRQFIYYLSEEVGLNIKIISTDGFQSVDMRQIFQSKGYDVKYTSLDRSPDGYDGLKSAINDQRIILLKGCTECYNELSELEKDNFSGKYDHPIYGSKDESDSLAGAFQDASQYKDEYLYYHPSDYDYEGLNETRSDEDKIKEDMMTALVGQPAATSSIPTPPSNPYEKDPLSDYMGQFDPNILFL